LPNNSAANPSQRARNTRKYGKLMKPDAADEKWMRRALRLATLSLGRTWPNPGVGCVVVKNGALIGEGRHAVYGQAHAEVNALNNCRMAGHDPAGATAYVTLAPCTKHGRQPPCTQALIAARVARVVAAISDPNQDDPGIILGQAGIIYEEGCGRVAAMQMHGGFLSRISAGRPRITGKWAMTLDGCLATTTGDSAWISSQEALTLSRRRRRAFDAIVVGSGTARSDDPRLLSSTSDERTPVRVVIAQHAEVALDSILLKTLNVAGVVIIHSATAEAMRLRELKNRGVELIAVADAHDPRFVAHALGKYGFNDILVEGGSLIHGAFLHAGLYDRLEIYLGQQALGGGLPVARGVGPELMQHASTFEHEVPPMVLGTTVYLRLRRPPVFAVGEEPVVVEGF
jgi:diaminohydroxyphosphoribosylaminopyrimidine deaminase / 5-amino-6-(5-phosphoribosylamino)uracil reductase